MKKSLVLIFILFSNILSAQFIKNVIFQVGSTPKFNYGMLTGEISLITNNNLYLGLDYHFGYQREAWTPRKTENRYYWYGDSRNLYLGYSVDKFYLSGLIGYSNSRTLYNFNTRVEHNYLNYGIQMGAYFRNLVLSTSYSNINKISFKVG